MWGGTRPTLDGGGTAPERRTGPECALTTPFPDPGAVIDERVQASGVDAGVMAAWATAWLRGAVAADDVGSALGAVDTHRVRGLGGGDSEPLAAALIAWRHRGAAAVRLVLPVPGDVRGLPAADPVFTAVALAARQVVIGSDLALVPQTGGSGQLVTWAAYDVGPVPPDPLTVRQAEVELAEAMREAATVLATLELGAPGVATPGALRATRRAGEHVELPPGHPGPAVALLAQARRLRAVLDLAIRDPRGAAVDRAGMAAREAALRPLITAVRRARLAACNAWAEPTRPT